MEFTSLILIQFDCFWLGPRLCLAISSPLSRYCLPIAITCDLCGKSGHNARSRTTVPAEAGGAPNRASSGDVVLAKVLKLDGDRASAESPVQPLPSPPTRGSAFFVHFQRDPCWGGQRSKCVALWLLNYLITPYCLAIASLLPCDFSIISSLPRHCLIISRVCLAILSSLSRGLRRNCLHSLSSYQHRTLEVLTFACCLVDVPPLRNRMHHALKLNHSLSVFEALEGQPRINGNKYKHKQISPSLPIYIYIEMFISMYN